MNERSPIADRWVARADEGSPEAEAGALLRQVLQREPIEEGRLAAIRHRLRGERRPPRRQHWVLRVAIALALMLSGGALMAAAQRYLQWRAPATPTPSEAPAPRVPRAGHGRAIASALPPSPPPPVEDVAPRIDDVAPPHIEYGGRSRAPTRRALEPSPAAVEPSDVTPPPAAAPPEGSASPLAQESKLLAEALRRLRQDDDPRRALAILDEHDARFARGALAPEATLARIEALIKLRRHADALALLDQAAPSPHASGRELLVARAELRAAAGRRAAAEADFDLLLRGAAALDSIAERALWGRASCRAAADDTTAARRDLQDYLGRFPKGRFAAQARAALGR